MAGVRMPRMIVASSRIPPPSASGEHLGLGARLSAEGDERQAEDQCRARHERPVRPMPSTTAVSVEPVRSYASRIRLMMKTW